MDAAGDDDPLASSYMIDEDEDGVSRVVAGKSRHSLEREVVRKIDRAIMPWIIIAYLINYLDRTNLGNARTLNTDRPGESLVESLDLTGDRYNEVVAVFFIPYVLFEFPSNFALKYFTPSRWISRIMITWGIVTVCTAFVSSYHQMLVSRVVLGVMEAGFFPGVVCYLCFWYPPAERATRMALFSASIAVAGALGGLIAGGVGLLSGTLGLLGWQWLFIVEGVPAILVGVQIFKHLPDYPETASFLSQAECKWAVERLGPAAPKGSDKHFDKAEFWATIQCWEFWVFALHYFLMTNSLNAFAYFAPSIISNLGFSGYQAQLLTIPPNLLGFLVILLNSYHSDKTRERPLHIIFPLLLVLFGYFLLASSPFVAVRYLGVTLTACTNAAVIPFIAYRTATVRGATGTAVATGAMIAIANSSGGLAPFLFRDRDAPRYLPGIHVIGWMLFGSIGLTLLLWAKLGASSDYRDAKSVPAGEPGEDASLLHET